MATVVSDQDAGVLRSFSESPPFSYILKVESFSLLADDSFGETNVKCESGVFTARGYNWKLMVYPKGNKKKNVEDHISVYLVMAENSLQPGEEVYVDEDHISDAFTKNFCFRGEVSGAVGFDKLASLKDFSDASNGYLIDDKCVFGAEVFVSKGRRPVPRSHCLSIRKTTSEKYKHTWKITNFSHLTAQSYEGQFTAGGHNWNIRFHPQGRGNPAGTHVGIFLKLANPQRLPNGTKLAIEFCLRIRDQKHGRHCTKKSSSTVCYGGDTNSWGWDGFVTPDDLRRENKGLLKKDTCLVEAELTINGTAMELSTLLPQLGETDSAVIRNIC